MIMIDNDPQFKSKARIHILLPKDKAARVVRIHETK